MFGFRPTPALSGYTRARACRALPGRRLHPPRRRGVGQLRADGGPGAARRPAAAAPRRAGALARRPAAAGDDGGGAAGRVRISRRTPCCRCSWHCALVRHRDRLSADRRGRRATPSAGRSSCSGPRSRWPTPSSAAARAPGSACCVLVAATAVAFEAVGLATGFPYGEYSYSDALGPTLLGVPFLVPLAWLMMAWPSWLLAERLARTARRAVVRIAVAAGIFAAWDVVLDPQMVQAGYWTWAHPEPGLPGIDTVPLTNLAGWLLAGAVLMTLLDLLVDADGGRRRSPDRRRGAHARARLDDPRRRARPRRLARAAGLGRLGCGAVGAGARRARGAVAGARGERTAAARPGRCLGPGRAARRGEHGRCCAARRTTRHRSAVRSPSCCRCATRSGTWATAWPRCSTSAGCPTCGSSSSTTARPTAPRTSSASVTDPRVRLVSAGPLPPDWLGKPHACAVGVAEAQPGADGVLVFVDADVRLFPDALASAVALLDRARARPRLPVAAAAGGRRRRAPGAAARALALGHDPAGAAGRAVAPAVAGRRQRPVPGAHRARLRAGGRARRRARRGTRGHRPAAGGQARGRARCAGRRLAAGGLPDVRGVGGSCATATRSRCGRRWAGRRRRAWPPPPR